MTKKIFYSTKTFNTDRGLSCCFRQWRATHSHCSQLHGYSIGIKLTFGCETLDERNWAMDFGGLDEFKQWAEYMFDHTLVVAEDDPMLEDLKGLQTVVGVADVRVVPAVGCERFAELCFDKINSILQKAKAEGKALNNTTFIDSVEVFEHGANSAICKASVPEPDDHGETFADSWAASTGIDVNEVKEMMTSLKDRIVKEFLK